MQKYEIKEFVPSAVPQPENAVANAFDNNIETRWAVDGANQWIKIDLGEVKPIEAIGVMVWKSTERDTLYGIEVSEDGENWIEVFDGQSSGTADNKFDFYSAYGESARYIKINCHGTNTGLWTSILELAVFGKKQ